MGTGTAVAIGLVALGIAGLWSQLPEIRRELRLMRM